LLKNLEKILKSLTTLKMAKRVRSDEGGRESSEVDVLKIQLAFERLLTDDAKADATETARIRAENKRLRAVVRELKADAVDLKNQTTLRETISLLKFKYGAMRKTVESLLGERHTADLDAALSEAWVGSQ
jgi:hypothetical protein